MRAVSYTHLDVYKRQDQQLYNDDYKSAERSENSGQLRYFITNPLLRKISISGLLGSLKAMTGVILTPLVTYYFASKNPQMSLIYTALFGVGSSVAVSYTHLRILG